MITVMIENAQGKQRGIFALDKKGLKLTILSAGGLGDRRIGSASRSFVII